MSMIANSLSQAQNPAIVRLSGFGHPANPFLGTASNPAVVRLSGFGHLADSFLATASPSVLFILYTAGIIGLTVLVERVCGRSEACVEASINASRPGNGMATGICLLCGVILGAMLPVTLADALRQAGNHGMHEGIGTWGEIASVTGGLCGLYIAYRGILFVYAAIGIGAIGALLIKAFG